jgi:S1-C subfamily serine protease
MPSPRAEELMQRSRGLEQQFDCHGGPQYTDRDWNHRRCHRTAHVKAGLAPHARRGWGSCNSQLTNPETLMDRVPVASSAAIWTGSVVAVLLSVSALGAERSRSATDEVPAAALEQRLEAAQRRLERAAQEVADLSTSLSGAAAADAGTARSSRRSQRAALGVNIGTDADGKRNEGVQVLSVTPRSGAYEAGLKSGDLLLAINNKPLRLDDGGSPRTKLLTAMQGVRAGEKVAVKYRREGFTKTVDLIARPIPDRPSGVAPRAAPVASVAPVAPVAPVRAAQAERVETPRVAIRRAEGILGGAELVPLTPRLGQYFGTDEGLLVVRAPSDENLDIQEGDVILEIDGRTPDSTSHAMRILRSYQPGEELSLSVYRRKRTFDIDLVIPEAAPRARLEQRLERSRNDSRALRQRPRANAVRPLPPPVAEESADLQVQPLPDEEIEIESNDD